MPPNATASIEACEGENGGVATKQTADQAVRQVLGEVLGLSAERVAAFDADTPLFGALPELDSMAVAGVLTELEDRLGILIEDDEVDGDMLETFGALTDFVAARLPT
nr:acyl carrier protein [Sphingomonas abaci]